MKLPETVKIKRMLSQSGMECRWQKAAFLGAIGLALVPAGCNSSSAPDSTPRSASFSAPVTTLPSGTAIPYTKESPQFLINKAIRDGDVTQVRRILKQNPEVLKAQGPTGTPLHVAAGGNALYGEKHPEVVKLLLESGADVNARNKRGDTPLQRAMAGRGHEKKTRVVALLLSHGADVNVKSGFSQTTPLHIAVDVGDVALVKLLLSHKADVNATNKQGKTPLQIVSAQEARRKAGDKKVLPLAKFFDIDKWPEIIMLLHQAGAK